MHVAIDIFKKARFKPVSSFSFFVRKAFETSIARSMKEVLFMLNFFERNFFFTVHIVEFFLNIQHVNL